MTTGHARPTDRLRRLALRGLFTQALCVAIALLLWVFAHGDLVWSLAYSLAIGNVSWASIDLGIHAVAWALARGRPAHAQARAWQGVPGLAVVGVVALGAAMGYSLGSTLVDAYTGLQSPRLWHGGLSGVITLLAAVAATFFFYTRERLQAERAAVEAARRSAVEHQLKLLESQLEPHMLFNTLANLRVLITLDPPRAQAMLDRLIAYLRATLGASRSAAHTLRAEFDRLADYLALMQVRMGERLQVHLDLPADLAELPVPPLLLQPLVENAIVHGLEPRVEGGRLAVSARRTPQGLELTVRDTGVGLRPGAAPGRADRSIGTAGGFGTRQVRERLAMLHGDRAWLAVQAAADAEGGTAATVVLPLPA